MLRFAPILSDTIARATLDTSVNAPRQRATLPAIFLALTPFALGYFLSYLFRAVNAVVAPDLVKELGLTPAELGLLTAAYLGAFALFQLPLGVLLDRFGPRRVQSALVALAGCGAVLFGVSQDALTLTIARAIIGLGFAGGLMAGFKAVVIWVPEPRRALANSCVMSLGALGLLISTTPMALASEAFGWRVVFLGLAAVTLFVAVVILLVVPERSVATASEPLGKQIGQVGRIYADRVFLAIVPFLAITAGTHIALQTLWAGPWFRDIAGYDRHGVANALFAMAAAFFVGVLFSGAVADWFVRRGVSLLTVTLGFLAIFMTSQALIIFDVMPEIRLAVWCVFGMTGQVAVLAYPWLSSYFGAHLSGRSNAAINLLLFMSAFLVQYAVGAIIGLYPVTEAGGYAKEAYTASFGVFFAIQVVALLWYLANWRRIRSADAKVSTGKR
jgi:predicted MFS family arabinose efflux permease